jgi:sec-independent protein translocase protein TatA
MPFAWWELVLILLVLLLVFGAKRLPEMGRSLGKGMREFKDSVSGMTDDRDDEYATPAPAELPPPAQRPASPTDPTGVNDPEPVPAEQPKRETVG